MFNEDKSPKYSEEKAKKLKPKSVYIVKGGPGTGKSVLAVNLLVEYIKNRKNARYVTKKLLLEKFIRLN